MGVGLNWTYKVPGLTHPCCKVSATPAKMFAMQTVFLTPWGNGKGAEAMGALTVFAIAELKAV